MYVLLINKLYGTHYLHSRLFRPMHLLSNWPEPPLAMRKHNCLEGTFMSYLYNYIMDLGQTWATSFEWPFANTKLDECNLIAHFDGGVRRQSGCAASVWVVEVAYLEHSQWTYNIIAHGGSYFQSLISSFVAETLTLLETSSFLRKIIEQHSSRKPSGKYRRV